MPLLNILLAEDNEADVILIRQALKLHDIEFELHLTKDGQEAIEFISRMGTTGNEPCPDIMLVDLNLPKCDGREVLQAFRKHPKCESTPVIVVTSSGALTDRERVSGLGVDRYFRKPSDLDEFMKLGGVVKQVLNKAAA